MRFTWVLVALILSSCATSKSLVHLGDRKVYFVTSKASEASNNPIYFNMHEDESTSIRAMRKYSKHGSIDYIYLKHTGTRRIKFSVDDKTYSVDPNRIYTVEGREKTLIDGGGYTLKADSIVELFAEQLVSKLSSASWVIAMHNNTEENYSILSYLPNGSEAQNTGEIHVNSEMDPDDFIYTTSKVIFDELKAQNVNVILQAEKNFVDDGSLSIFCGINNIPYINIETQHGHLNEQLKLMELIENLTN